MNHIFVRYNQLPHNTEYEDVTTTTFPRNYNQEEASISYFFAIAIYKMRRKLDGIKLPYFLTNNATRINIVVQNTNSKNQMKI